MSRSKQVEPKVEQLLQHNEDLRSSDKKLLMRFWEAEGFYLTPHQQSVFLDCTPAESITRARRALRPKYPGDKKTEEQRYENFQQEQADHSDFAPKAISWRDDN